MKNGSEVRESAEFSGVISIPSLVARLFWTFIGPMGLLLVVIGMVTRKVVELSSLDVAYGAIVLLMICCRWLEQHSDDPTTAAGLPSRPRDLHRYIFILIEFATTLWVWGKVVVRFTA